ncbi:hypothetical protein ISF_04571 [Cordyceps fumosorosea ARSEF 2679]|uniref:Uncharacterized protein n=1 Tax=Cordyceps fumosorosea (strain ARSEF 2679) TaxID=1081104 RepID=A0A162J548_CORFA|nr:hypothetical protein ISF_04571 [Cordyceps fumosorosea ARSEF 2679]OAA63862.1 hypothetical protein ISF_04571 [Cordyceps fumosorosea ARSEF 2679]
MAAASTSSPSLTPTSSAFRPILLYDKDAPATVIASVVTAIPQPSGWSGPADYIEFRVTCALPFCPANSFPPQTVTQRQGSVWGGHHVVAGTITAWDCRLGRSGDDDEGDYGSCYTTTLPPTGRPVPTTGRYTRVGTCDVDARSKMMFVTAGFNEYFKVMPAETGPPIDLPSAITSVLRSAHCPSSAFPTPGKVESKSATATSTNGASSTESRPAATPTGEKSNANNISRAFSLLLSIPPLLWHFVYGEAAGAVHSRIVIEVEPEAEEAWSQRVLGGTGYRDVLSTCTPGYLSREGLGLRIAHGLAETADREAAARTARAIPWSAGLQAFLDELPHWREDVTLAGYRISGF